MNSEVPKSVILKLRVKRKLGWRGWRSLHSSLNPLQLNLSFKHLQFMSPLVLTFLLLMPKMQFFKFKSRFMSRLLLDLFTSSPLLGIDMGHMEACLVLCICHLHARSAAVFFLTKVGFEAKEETMGILIFTGVAIGDKSPTSEELSSTGNSWP